MGTEVNVEVDVSNIDNLSQAEMEALEDKMYADEASPDAKDPAAASPEPTPAAEPAAPQKNAETGGEQPGDAKDGEDPEAKSTPADPAKEGEPDPELVKHVSPPSKWAQERHEKKELRDKLATAEEKAAKTDTLEEELSVVRGEMDWMKTAIESKGIELPSNPLETFSEEKITEIRDEFGDELADMFQATKAVLAGQSTKPTSTPAAKKEADPEPAAPAQPAAQPQAQPADTGPDKDLLEAISDNDELSYWQENSPALWNKAIELDGTLLQDPAYQSLPYKDRFLKVVEQVKTDVMKGAIPKKNQNQGDGKPPADTLSGAGGDTPPQTGNSAYDRVMAASDADAQLKVYNTLSQADRDLVDQALDI